ncbi:MAG: hypothetical protein K9I71_00205 [Ignavibacteriales bacterium]|nr:hypothetical protein [Ignavibacteriales bacterium]MCF8314512.1 hypothetical protein [Ignavibacteriales bacterium]MCF8436451.1 hypothetical protein [Ignavibacteriales bacterium]
MLNLHLLLDNKLYSHLYAIIFLVIFSVPQLTKGQSDCMNSSLNFRTSDAGFGFGYDSLIAKLETWKQSPYIQVDSIGVSVQHRTIWMITIKGDHNHPFPVYRVAIHARTHPNEVQSEYLAHSLIKYLTQDSDLGRTLRQRFEFTIVPMFNPDGVELGYARTNANLLDLERNWFTTPHEPEVQALKNLYAGFMNSFLPIRIALNLHGDGGAVRDYFVFHHENGTSAAYAEDERYFINSIRAHNIEELHEWDYAVTWTNGNPMLFPESWFWEYYSEYVMALTYEKTTEFSPDAAVYDSAANAILKGIIDYLDITAGFEPDKFPDKEYFILQNYPNPFNPATKITFSIPEKQYVSLIVYDVLGNVAAELEDGILSPGPHNYIFNGSEFSSGFYLCVLRSESFSTAHKLLLIR